MSHLRGCAHEYHIGTRLTRRSVDHSEPTSVFGGLSVPADVLEELRANIARRLTPQPVKVRADLEVTNFAFSGILAIQAALAAGEALSTPEIPIKIKLVAPPLYVMVSSTTDKQGAIDLLEKACEVIGERIREEEGGSLHVRMRPKAVSETDDAELQALMDRYGLRLFLPYVSLVLTYLLHRIIVLLARTRKYQVYYSSQFSCAHLADLISTYR